MPQQAATLDVTEELVTKSRAIGGTLDQTGDVGGNKSALLTGTDNAEVGGKGREMVSCDLGFGGADRR
jgi:hypothetical protein